MQIPSELRALPLLREHLLDLELWTPILHQVLESELGHVPEGSPQPGTNPTFPTFLVGPWVVKFYGGLSCFRESFRAESQILSRLASLPEIPAPQLLAQGRLDPDRDLSWPYTIQARLLGRPLREAGLAPLERLALIRDLGVRFRALGGVSQAGLPRLEAFDEDWILACLARSSLPPALFAQVPEYLAAWRSRDPVLVHGDLVGNQIWVRDGELEGVLDWGDALVADPYFELPKLFFGALDRDREALRAFLEGAEFCLDSETPDRFLSQAILRQAKGLRQHRGFDVFDGLETIVDLEAISSLPELARAILS